MEQQPIISDNVVEAIEKVEPESKRDHRGPFTTSTGVVLKYHKVPSQILIKAWANLVPPTVPEVWIEDHGRFEPNPFSPSYLEALSAHRNKRLHVSTLIWFMRGLEVFSIPEGMHPIESDEWFEGLEDILDVPKKGDARKAAWLMYYACPDDEEQGQIIEDLGVVSGMVLQKDVDAALDSFRNNEGKEANNGSSSTS